MGRPSKKNDEMEATKAPISQEPIETTGSSAEVEIPQKESEQKNPSKENLNDSKEIPGKVLELMRLYPQYEEIWVTSDGFVHPKNVPAYRTKGATLYKNKFHKK